MHYSDINQTSIVHFADMHPVGCYRPPSVFHKTYLLGQPSHAFSHGCFLHSRKSLLMIIRADNNTLKILLKFLSSLNQLFGLTILVIVIVINV